MIKIINKSKQGKANRRKGKEFENLVRKDLESKGWIVSKWQNNVEFTSAKYHKYPDFIITESGQKQRDENRAFLLGEKIGKLIPCKAKFNPFTKRVMMQSGGFPDFVAYINGYNFPPEERAKVIEEYLRKNNDFFSPIGVEAKSNGYLDKEEREKCKWLLNNHIFSKILIAKKGKEEIEYNEFKK